MLKITFIIVLFFSSLVVFSQNCEELTIEKNRLSEQVQKLQNDSINFQKRIDDYGFVIRDVRDSKNELRIRNEQLNRKKIKIDRDKLREEVASQKAKIADLEQNNLKKDTLIAEAELKIKQTANEEREKGKQEAYNQIAQTYNQPFDNLLKFSTKQSVERDLLLVGDDKTVMKKLQNLQSYFIAKQVLSEQYNEKNVKLAQDQLNDITEQSVEIDQLKTLIKNYKLFNDALKVTIDKIIDIDKRFIANDDEYNQTLKQKEILAELASYFRNYRFNFTDYPYLSEIVLEIMTRKQRNANADIRDLFEKL